MEDHRDETSSSAHLVTELTFVPQEELMEYIEDPTVWSLSLDFNLDSSSGENTDFSVVDEIFEEDESRAKKKPVATAPRRQRKRRRAKPQENRQKRPLYDEDLTNVAAISAEKMRSIKKSLKCKLYREKEKEFKHQLIRANEEKEERINQLEQKVLYLQRCLSACKCKSDVKV